MTSHPDHIFELRRSNPDIHSHFVGKFLPYIQENFPGLVFIALESAQKANISPVLEISTQPWPIVWAERESGLTPDDFCVIHALDTLLLSLNYEGARLHTCNHKPSLASRRRDTQHRASFSITPKINSYS